MPYNKHIKQTHTMFTALFDKYKMYVASKPWVCDNYLRLPNRKPEWV